MASCSETARWSDLAMPRNSESNSEDSSSSESLLSKALEHTESNLSVRRHCHLKMQQKNLDLWNRICLSHSPTVHLLMNCPHLPMLTNTVNGCLTRRGKSYCAEAEVVDSCTWDVCRCGCGYCEIMSSAQGVCYN